MIGRAWLLLAALGVAGLGTSGYLTYSHYADRATVCAGIGSCEFVQTSAYSEVVGVPVALLGLLFFIALEVLVVMRFMRLPLALQWGQPAVFAMTLGGLAFVIYLTYVELFVIDAICIWCVATAAITLVCFVVVAAMSLWGEEEPPG